MNAFRYIKTALGSKFYKDIPELHDHIDLIMQISEKQGEITSLLPLRNMGEPMDSWGEKSLKYWKGHYQKRKDTIREHIASLRAMHRRLNKAFPDYVK